VFDGCQDAFSSSHFPFTALKKLSGQATFCLPHFVPYLHAFFLAQPLLFFAVVDFLVAALGISPHPLRQENLPFSSPK